VVLNRKERRSGGRGRQKRKAENRGRGVTNGKRIILEKKKNVNWTQNSAHKKRKDRGERKRRFHRHKTPKRGTQTSPGCQRVFFGKL